MALCSNESLALWFRVLVWNLPDPPRTAPPCSRATRSSALAREVEIRNEEIIALAAGLPRDLEVPLEGGG